MKIRKDLILKCHHNAAVSQTAQQLASEGFSIEVGNPVQSGNIFVDFVQRICERCAGYNCTYDYSALEKMTGTDKHYD